ncbi:MAG: hypothetical protein NZT92_00080 [Abditibacteriales bacterium]|nr:hypothetical protein [Abditibacteriales bacterium]MDW8364907.1 hypothetical protein [Abditibacteriales bacterium]
MFFSTSTLLYTTVARDAIVDAVAARRATLGFAPATPPCYNAVWG